MIKNPVIQLKPDTKGERQPVDNFLWKRRNLFLYLLSRFSLAYYRQTRLLKNSSAWRRYNILNPCSVRGKIKIIETRKQISSEDECFLHKILLQNNCELENKKLFTFFFFLFPILLFYIYSLKIKPKHNSNHPKSFL